jgi:prolipoprotein diacylglyceryltransferase
MDFIRSLNQCLDQLPRPRLGCLGREAPAFRTCGFTGFYVALLVLFGGGLLAGRSLLVLAALALVSALSFYAYTYLRMWITGQETLVLLEHVWFALASNAAALWAMGEPLLPYLDVVSVALCPFLAAGRIGCTLVGCCRGRPSSLGITYDEACARDGFPHHLVGVRLFPVAAIEALGLLVIGMSGLIALPLAQPGKVLAWYLLAYSVLRFGLEGLRGDPRPHFFGLSQARWMAIFEVGLALQLSSGEHRVPAVMVYAALLATLLAALAFRWRRDGRRRWLNLSHVREVRELVRNEIERGAGDLPAPSALQMTSQQVAVAVSAAGAALPNTAQVSLSLPHGRSDLPLLCELAARAFPRLIIEAAQYTLSRVLHLRVPLADGLADPASDEDLGQLLYGRVVRRAQHQSKTNGHQSLPEPIEPQATAQAEYAMLPAGDLNSSDVTTPWYYADLSGKKRW